MKIDPISIFFQVFFIGLLIIVLLFPMIAIQSVYEVYNAAYNYKKQEEINFEQLGKGDTFWAQIEVSTDNKDTSGMVAYTSAYLYKPTHVWARKDIKTFVPYSILVHAGGKKNIPLLIDTKVIDFEFLPAYETPFLGEIGFFSIRKNRLPTVNLSEKDADGYGYIAKGIMEGKPLFAKYKIESSNPLILSTKNPTSFPNPEKLWKAYTNNFFWPYAHLLASLFLIIGVFIIYSFVRKILKK